LRRRRVSHVAGRLRDPGMDPDFRNCFTGGPCPGRGRIRWTILSAFRDDYRQGLAPGTRPVSTIRCTAAAPRPAAMGTAAPSHHRPGPQIGRAVEMARLPTRSGRSAASVPGIRSGPRLAARGLARAGGGTAPRSTDRTGRGPGGLAATPTDPARHRRRGADEADAPCINAHRLRNDRCRRRRPSRPSARLSSWPPPERAGGKAFAPRQGRPLERWPGTRSIGGRRDLTSLRSGCNRATPRKRVQQISETRIVSTRDDLDAFWARLCRDALPKAARNFRVKSARRRLAYSRRNRHAAFSTVPSATSPPHWRDILSRRARASARIDNFCLSASAAGP